MTRLGARHFALIPTRQVSHEDRLPASLDADPSPTISACVWCCVVALGLTVLPARAAGQSKTDAVGRNESQAGTNSDTLEAGPPITYLLDLCEPQSHRVRVTMTVPQSQPRTQLQFPAWNAVYQIRDFVRNVQALQAECDGQPLELSRVDLETWEAGPKGCSSLQVRYAVYANEDSVFSSVLNEEHAFLNFALLLFYLPQERERGVRVKFLLPAGWKLATLLEEGAGPGEFEAANYDALADSPAEAGEFQEFVYTLDRVPFGGGQGMATVRVVVHADPATYSCDRLLKSLEKITTTEASLMRDIPFRRYTFILHFPREGGGGAMEHRNGTAISVSATDLRRDWRHLEATVAHEFFHLWNVKRIRPQALEPVDYIRGNDTQDLWFAEGITSTYEELTLLRAGLMTRQMFYQRLAQEIRRLEERPARHFQSVEQAGREAWLEKYPDYLRPQRSISYYNKGALVGFLLDLAIRHASLNQRSLDDVLRRLNEDFARRHRFFTQTDLRAIVAGLAPAYTGLQTFFGDYVSGTRELDYDTYLGFAGLRLVTESAERPELGFLAVQNFDEPVVVASVEPGSNAQRAGLKTGDVLLKMNGEPLKGPPQDAVDMMKPGQRVEFQVRRGDRVIEVEFVLGKKHRTIYRVEESLHATPEQLQVREGWLEGKVARRAGAEDE